MAGDQYYWDYPAGHPMQPRTMTEAYDVALSAALIRIDQLEERVAELESFVGDIEKHVRGQIEILRLLKDESDGYTY